MKFINVCHSIPDLDRVLPRKDAIEAHRLLEGREVQGTILLDTTA